MRQPARIPPGISEWEKNKCTHVLRGGFVVLERRGDLDHVKRSVVVELPELGLTGV